MDIVNCTRCGGIYVKNPVRDICDQCYKEEEEAFDKVSSYLKKREHRTASMLQVVRDTGVPEELIMKFIKKGRIKLVQFPNLAYPCEKCGKPIQTGKFCDECITEFKTELEIYEKEEQWKKEMEEKRAYYAVNEKFRKRQ